MTALLFFDFTFALFCLWKMFSPFGRFVGLSVTAFHFKRLLGDTILAVGLQFRA